MPPPLKPRGYAPRWNVTFPLTRDREITVCRRTKARLEKAPGNGGETHYDRSADNAADIASDNEEDELANKEHCTDNDTATLRMDVFFVADYRGAIFNTSGMFQWRNPIWPGHVQVIVTVIGYPSKSVSLGEQRLHFVFNVKARANGKRLADMRPGKAARRAQLPATSSTSSKPGRLTIVSRPDLWPWEEAHIHLHFTETGHSRKDGPGVVRL